jgi:HSP20 family protein
MTPVPIQKVERSLSKGEIVMADVNVKKQNTQNGEQALQKRSERGLSRGGWDPFVSLKPSDFFNSDPFSWMRRVHQEMDRTFANIFGRESEAGDVGNWYPAVEVIEQDGQLKIHADLPGMKPEDVKVELTDDALTIQGERKDEHNENKGGVHRSERRYGHFYREIPIPEGAKAEEAKAQFKDGVLEVSVPVPEQKSNRRTIPIESSSPESVTTAER